jgi:hypothetical protein
MSSTEEDRKAKDAEPENFVKSKMSAEDWKTYDAMCKARDKRAKDEAEAEKKKAEDAKRAKDSEEEEAKKKKEAEDKRAADAKKAKDAEAEAKKRDEEEASEDRKRARDGETEEQRMDRKAKDKRARDAEGASARQQGVEKLETGGGAMDAAVVEKMIGAAVAASEAKHRAIREAEQAVAPFVGRLEIAEDSKSAETVYATALGQFAGVKKDEIAGLPLPALKILFSQVATAKQSSALASASGLALDSGRAGDGVLSEFFAKNPAPQHV